jgi:hypothetical protein
MKAIQTVLALAIVAGAALSANAQNPDGWQMLLNNDHSAFRIKLVKNELIFYFNPASDTLSFSQIDKKAIKPGAMAEASVKSTNKIVYSTSSKNFNPDKTELVIPMTDVHRASQTLKLPPETRYTIVLKGNNNAREKIMFEFSER